MPITAPRAILPVALSGALLLVACGGGGGGDVYVSPNGDELRLVSETQAQRTVGNRVIEGSYRWERDAQGNVRWLDLDDSGLGDIRFMPAENGCLTSRRVGGPWCPR